MKIYVVDGDWSEDWGVWNVVDFLWHQDQDVDTDGDSYKAENWDWIEMYVSNRENDEVFYTQITQDEPLVVCVESPFPYLCARVAYFLAAGSQGRVALALEGVPQTAEFLRTLMGAEFDVEAAKKRGFGHSLIVDLMLERYKSEAEKRKNALAQENSSNELS